LNKALKANRPKIVKCNVKAKISGHENFFLLSIYIYFSLDLVINPTLGTPAFFKEAIALTTVP
jgi:hypothetical protein